MNGNSSHVNSTITNESMDNAGKLLILYVNTFHIPLLLTGAHQTMYVQG